MFRYYLTCNAAALYGGSFNRLYSVRLSVFLFVAHIGCQYLSLSARNFNHCWFSSRP